MPKTAKLDSMLAKVRLFLTDVDGVLTDGGIFIGAEGEMKRFSILDGAGQKLLQKSGIQVGWISNRASTATQRRAEELKVDFISQGSGSKVKAAEEILAKTGFTFAEVCYVGDDLVDLAVLSRAGLAVAVANAVQEVKMTAHYVTKTPGGSGAVREVAELILKAQGKWDEAVKSYRS